jgi:hypothetical protein
VDPLRQVHHFFQQPVEAVADQHALFHRLDVDVAGGRLDRALHDQVDEIDDRRGFAALLEAGDRLVAVFVAPPHQRLGADRRLSHGRTRRGHLGTRPRGAHQGLVGIARRDGFENVGARCDHLLDAITGLELEVLHQAEQQRVGHRDGEQVLVETNGDARALERDVLGDQRDDVGVGRIFRKVEIRKTQLVGQGFGDLTFGCEVEADEYCTQALARAFVFRQRSLQVVFGDEPGLDQALTQLFPHRSSAPHVAQAYF